MSEPHLERRVAPSSTREDLIDLYETYVGDVYSFVARRCGEGPLAEDITQEVFLSAARRFAERGEVPAPAWLFSTARSRVIDHWRRQSRRRAKLRLIGEDSPEVDPADRIVTVHELAAALDDLPDTYRAALCLRYLEGDSVAEVAETLQRSLRATESLLARARRSLEQRIGGRTHG